MKRISSQWTFYYKRLFPAIFFVGVATGLATILAVPTRSNPPPRLFLLIFLVFAVFMYFLFRRLLIDLADEVLDGGASLLVKKGGIEERVAFSNLMNVSHTHFMNPQRVTLTLRVPGKFGKEISFIPPVRVFAFTFQKHPLVDELIDRIDRARGDRADDR
jgi:hypothetical protein